MAKSMKTTEVSRNNARMLYLMTTPIDRGFTRFLGKISTASAKDWPKSLLLPS
jgi:hypothetical protein